MFANADLINYEEKQNNSEQSEAKVYIRSAAMNDAMFAYLIENAEKDKKYKREKNIEDKGYLRFQNFYYFFLAIFLCWGNYVIYVGALEKGIGFHLVAHLIISAILLVVAIAPSVIAWGVCTGFFNSDRVLEKTLKKMVLEKYQLNEDSNLNDVNKMARAISLLEDLSNTKYFTESGVCSDDWGRTIKNFATSFKRDVKQYGVSSGFFNYYLDIGIDKLVSLNKKMKRDSEVKKSIEHLEDVLR